MFGGKLGWFILYSSFCLKVGARDSYQWSVSLF